MLLLVVLLCYSSYSNAQAVVNPTQTSPDLLDPSAQNWSGNFGTGYWGGSRNPGGANPSIPNRIPNDSGFIWGGANEILSTTIAINSALQVAGIQVNGFEYEWRVKNGNANIFGQQPGIDDFVIEVDIYDAQGNLYATYQYDYSYSHNWTTHSGQELFTDPFLPPSYFDRVEISAQGQDVGNWQGWYGPEFNVAQSSFSVIFSANPCHNNPLYDPQCQGYANALFNQQCTQNPLYDPTCPGYAAAYLTQQCSANPLYDPACPGYANAYYTQQCQLNPLYDQNCPGYAAANLAQQCDWDPLYDVQCPNYQQAYLEKQCESDPLYDVQCAGYQTAIELAKIVDDGSEDDPTVIDNEIDVTTTTEIEGVPNVISLPEQQIEIVEVEDGDGFQEVEDDIQKEQMAMEDDIEKEIEELENAAGGEKMEDDIEKEIAEIESTTGNTEQEDDIEKELAELKDSTSENKQDVKKKPKTKNEKIKLLLAMKAIELTKKIEQETNLENQMVIQRQLLALISYVPGFDYNEKENKDGNFYPPKPTVDHAFARWFLNDPNFDTMENLQYPNLN